MTIRAGMTTMAAVTGFVLACAALPGRPVAAPGGDCDALLARIRSTLQIAKLRPADAARVEALRDRGASLLAAGNLTGCLPPLREAAAKLGM